MICSNCCKYIWRLFNRKSLLAKKYDLKLNKFMGDLTFCSNKCALEYAEKNKVRILT